MYEEEIFQFDGDEYATGQDGALALERLKEALGWESDGVELLEQLAFTSVCELDWERVPLLVDWREARTRDAMADVVRAAAQLHWIAETELGPDAWHAFVRAWRPRDFVGDESDEADEADGFPARAGGAQAPYGVSAALPVGHSSAAGWEPQNPTWGTDSFEAAVGTDRLALDRLGLVSGVPVTGLPAVDPERFRGTIGGGLLCTHDGKFLIDTSGITCRYLISLQHGEAVLYVDQRLSASDWQAAGATAVSAYPSLDSHGQIATGQIVCAGDMQVSEGRIVYIDNHSGSYTPRGSNLAAVLHLVKEFGILADDAAIRQFLSKVDGYDCDAGELRQLNTGAVQERLEGRRQDA
ncbi:hypothetical protein [Streptomyces sp. NPDC001594]|uniref:hypothetical protein n=1 Tax=Streptomyces sp. NPDC001594 TaxID=3364590 RepID=UPI0036AFD5F4